MLELEPDRAGVHLNLGDALAAEGHLAEAVAQYRKAQALAEAGHDEALTAESRDRLRTYETNSAGREKP